jgi:aspartate-semialdehyde dehydrogenase
MSGDGYRVGVLGATGAVGSTILGILAERDFPASEVIPFASERSAGRRLTFGEAEVACQVPGDETIQDIDILISSAGGSVSEVWAPRFVEAGAVVIDNTSFWRMHDEVPLVVAGVNDDAARNHKGIVANPNCTTMVMMMALSPIHREAGLERLILSSYQAVSGTGQKAIEELKVQSARVLAGEPIDPPSVYPHQIGFNVLPQVETFKDGDDYTTEERKVMAETRKILGFGDEVGISATCARVPVISGHSESLNIQTRDELSPERCRDLLDGAVGVTVIDEPSEGRYPTALQGAGRDEVLVGRIRRDPSHERCLNLWLVGDNLRKGAATNAVQVAELLVDRGWLTGS